MPVVGPGERERRRWAAIRLDGKSYREGHSPEEIHADLRAAPEVTRRNIRKSPYARTAHANCPTCLDILVAGRPTTV